MRNAYALLGLSFIIVFGSAYILFKQSVEVPTTMTAVEDPLIETENMSLILTSPAFSDGEMIPEKYTCDGENVNPPLEISNVPADTKVLVLVMDDPDIPQAIKDARGIEEFDHWAVYNLPADTTIIEPETRLGTNGLNSLGAAAYTGPCPPTEYEPTTHRYIFRLYALSKQLNFTVEPTLDEVEVAAESVVLEKAVLTGLYSRLKE